MDDEQKGLMGDSLNDLDDDIDFNDVVKERKKYLDKLHNEYQRVFQASLANKFSSSKFSIRYIVGIRISRWIDLYSSTEYVLISLLVIAYKICALFL